MTDPFGPVPPSAPAPPARRRVPVRFLLLGLLVLALVLAVVGDGARRWWADRVGDLTGGATGADFVVGLAVTLLPLAGVALGAIGRRRGMRRAVRMLAFGTAGFVALYVVSPSPAAFLTDTGVTRYYDRVVPGYLAGGFTAGLLWIAVVVAVVVRVRSRWRRFLGTTATARDREGREPSHRIIDI